MGLSKIKVELNIFLNFGTEVNKQWEEHKYCDWVGLNTRVGFYWRKIQGLVVLLYIIVYDLLVLSEAMGPALALEMVF